MRWKRLRVVPVMAANTCMCGANAGDHFIGHEELAETKEAARVERATKRLVDEVKVSDFLYCCTFYALSCMVVICLLCRAQ